MKMNGGGQDQVRVKLGIIEERGECRPEVQGWNRQPADDHYREEAQALSSAV